MNIQVSFLFLAICLPLIGGCRMADIRPDALVARGAEPADVERGQTLLRTAATAHGIESWAELTTIEARIRDDWRGLAGLLFKPWDEDDVFTLRWVAGTFDSELAFVAGDRRGDRRGLQNGRAWSEDHNDPLVFEPDEETRFYTSAYIYFFELAFRLGSAEHTVALDDEVFRGQTYHRVFATWGGLAPHSGADQFVVWINSSTGLIDLCQFTVRDQFDFVESWIYFDDVRRVDSVSIPFTSSVTSSLDEDYLDSYVHQLRVQTWRHDSFDVADLYPDPSLGRMGSAKPPLADPVRDNLPSDVELSEPSASIIDRPGPI